MTLRNFSLTRTLNSCEYFRFCFWPTEFYTIYDILNYFGGRAARDSDKQSSSSLLGSPTAPFTITTSNPTISAVSEGFSTPIGSIVAHTSQNYRKFLSYLALSGLSAAAIVFLYNRFYRQKQKPITLNVQFEEDSNLVEIYEFSSFEAPSQEAKMAAEETLKPANSGCNSEEVVQCSFKRKEEATHRVEDSYQPTGSIITEMEHLRIEPESSGTKDEEVLHCSSLNSSFTSEKKEFGDCLTREASINDQAQNMQQTSLQQASSVDPNANHSPHHGYKNADSPSSMNSDNSADSGRATGGFTSTSPFDIGNDMDAATAAAVAASAAATTTGMLQAVPYYEFEVPNTLVGLIIGVGGKTIKELCARTDVKMLIRPHHTPAKYDTHQICSVEGKRENINRCLHMIKGRFPMDRFPDLNLKPVMPPPITPLVATCRPQLTPMQLAMPVGVPCEVFVSATVDAGHFFVQQPTHPSFSSLQLLDYYMLSVYSQISGIPELPRPCGLGVLCAAPAYNGWFRALTLCYNEEQDEVLVKFVDYGGFANIPRADLRQIRTDFLSLPLQAIECYLANVQPADGTSYWNEEANELFQKVCSAKIIQAELAGYTKNENAPAVVLFYVDEDKNVQRVDQVLLEKGLAKPADPTRLIRLPQTASVSSSSLVVNGPRDEASTKSVVESVTVSAAGDNGGSSSS